MNTTASLPSTSPSVQVARLFFWLIKTFRLAVKSCDSKSLALRQRNELQGLRVDTRDGTRSVAAKAQAAREPVFVQLRSQRKACSSSCYTRLTSNGGAGKLVLHSLIPESEMRTAWNPWITYSHRQRNPRASHLRKSTAPERMPM
jgi:hypothetical protein